MRIWKDNLIIAWVMAAMNGTTGHGHAGTQNDGKLLTSAAYSADSVTFPAIDDDGNFGLFTGDWSFNELALVEDTAPATAAGEMKIYTKDSGTEPELFVRRESSGTEIQVTDAGGLKGVGLKITAGTPCVQNPWTASTITTQAHGLGAAPTIVVSYFECLSADINYSTGDRVDMGLAKIADTHGSCIEWDATNVVILSHGTMFLLPNKTSSATFTNATASKWKVVAVPYLIA
jgi:hypothetical protein